MPFCLSRIDVLCSETIPLIAATCLSFISVGDIELPRWCGKGMHVCVRIFVKMCGIYFVPLYLDMCVIVYECGKKGGEIEGTHLAHLQTHSPFISSQSRHCDHSLLSKVCEICYSISHLQKDIYFNLLIFYCSLFLFLFFNYLSFIYLFHCTYLIPTITCQMRSSSAIGITLLLPPIDTSH